MKLNPEGGFRDFWLRGPLNNFAEWDSKIVNMLGSQPDLVINQTLCKRGKNALFNALRKHVSQASGLHHGVHSAQFSKSPNPILTSRWLLLMGVVSMCGHHEREGPGNFRG